MSEFVSGLRLTLRGSGWRANGLVFFLVGVLLCRSKMIAEARQKLDRLTSLLAKSSLS